METLKQAKTRELVDELESREGVGYVALNPDGSCTVKVEGPAIVLVVTD